MKSLHAGALPILVLYFSLIFATPPAAAVYKCEQAGVITYTDIPCDGEQLSVTLPERAREAEDKSLLREKKEAARLQALREQRERQDKQIRDLSARGAAARERKCKSLALQLKWREEDLREAPLGSQDKARKMARRAAEKYRNDCQ
jgi:hypothetical protein